MLLLYTNYTLIFWLLIGNSHADKHLLRRITDDQQIYGIAACTTRCLQQSQRQQQQQHQQQQEVYAAPTGGQQALHAKEQKQQQKTLKHPQQLVAENYTLFEVCTDHCKRESKLKPNIPVRLIQENFILQLVCRDEKSLSFRIEWAELVFNQEQPRNETTTNVTQNIIFVLKLHMTVEPTEYLVYLSDEPFFTVDGLQHNSSYNVMVVAVHDSNEYSVIAKAQTFKTLRRGYTPKMINDVKVLGYSEDKFSTKHLWANIEWRPSADMNCDYDMICFSPENDEYDALPVEIRDPRELYTYSIPNLTFSSEYKIGIRAKNRNNRKESQLFWHTFRAPSCEQWFNYNFNVCAPLKPSGLSVEQTFITEDLLALNITWQKPQHMPDYYVVHVLDLRQNGTDHIINVAKDEQHAFIPEIAIKGMLFEVHLVACTPGGNSSVFVTIPTHQQIGMYVGDKGYAFKLIFVILAPILCFVVLTLTSFIIYNRRAKLQRYQERCRYFEELEKKAPIDPKSFDFPPKTLAAPIPLPTPSPDNPPLLTQFQRDLEEKFLQNDELEIDRNDLTLHEILGEGAFGLVRRGVYKQREVAVKMLKDQPNMDEIRAFRHEIEVMKSVEHHPNIVSLIGHCTKQQGEVMLLTEYCSLGNLQSFLREEWTFLHELRNKLKINANKLQEAQQKTPTNVNRGNKKLTKLHYFKQNLNLLQKHNHQQQQQSAAAVISPTTATPGLQCQQSNAIKLDMQIEDITTTTLPGIALLSNNKSSADLPPLSNPNESGVPSPTSSTATTLSTDNKSYGYDEICTNSCKCQVDIISINDMDHHNDVAAQQVANQLEKLLQQRQQQEQPGDEPQSIAKPKAKSITIKNCECRGKRQKQQQPPQPQPPKGQLPSNKPQKSKAKSKSVANAAYFINNKSQQQLREDNNNTEDKYALQLLADRQPLSAADLLDIAKQVASGMEYLGKNKVVHRDLAARNVLITSDRTIKIADFGLSRDIYQENIYKKTGNGKLPIKWLALESMTHQVYTTQSDVWSYGILLYEIVSLGGLPYPTIPANRLLHLLKSGYRMERPDNCGEELYKLMYSCWSATPTERPTFTNIIRQLDELSEKAEQQISYANKFGCVAATMMGATMKTLPALQSSNISSSQMPPKDNIVTSTNNNTEDYLQPV